MGLLVELRSSGKKQMTKDTISFTKAEIGYLLQIAYESRDEGSYWGNHKDFIKRQNGELFKKLKTTLDKRR